MDAYIGEIRIFSGSYAPQGWLLCNGSTVAINEYQALYSLLGNQFGGDGKSTFGLPNLCGRLPVGDGQLTGGANYTVAQTGGADTVALTGDNMPVHTHPVYASNGAATTNLAGNTMVLASVEQPTYRMYMDTQQATGTWAPLSPTALNSCSGGAAHSNTMPTFVLNYIICVQGEYPDIQ